MRRTLTAAVALLTAAAIFVAVAAGGTAYTRQRVTIDIKGTDPFGYQLFRGRGEHLASAGSATFCCWNSWDITRAGAKVEVTNPIITLAQESGRGRTQLKIRERIEWTPLSDGSSVFKGTWKVVGSSGDYRGFKGHGFVAGTWAPETDPNRMLNLRLQGFLHR